MFYQDTFFYWRLQEICKRRLWERASLSIRDPLRNLEWGWGFDYRSVRETVHEIPVNGASPSMGPRGGWREISFTEKSES